MTEDQLNNLFIDKISPALFLQLINLSIILNSLIFCSLTEMLEVLRSQGGVLSDQMSD